MMLGISPGTRSCGFAVVRDTEIKKCGVKSYKETWSDGKLIGILYGISQLSTRHNIRRVAVKVPDVMPRSVGYAQLIGALNVLFEQRGIQVTYYTLSDLNMQFAPKKKITRKALFAQIADLYPELKPLYDKEVKAEKPYYDKVLEAVGVVHCVATKKMNCAKSSHL